MLPPARRPTWVARARARSWLYEAVLAPASTRLKAELTKVPALEFLVNPATQSGAAAAVRARPALR
jgi:hypothetical protein